jgi:hypothetical protein
MKKILLLGLAFFFFGIAQSQLIPYKNLQKKWGFRNSLGIPVVNPKYDTVYAFSENRAAVKLNGFWGYINQSGVEVIKPQYFFANSFSEGLAAIWDGKAGFINKDGTRAFPFIYEHVSSFENGKAKVLKNHQWIYIDKRGNTVTAPLTPLNHANIENFGKFKLLIELERTDVGNLRMNPAVRSITQNKMLENIVTSMNSIYKLPHDIPVTFKRIKEFNAFYHPKDRTITFGVEMVEGLYNLFSQIYSGQQLTDATTNAVVYILFHEMGHSFIDIFNIPISGRQEEAADFFATYLFTRGSEDLEKIAINGAEAFYILANTRKGTANPAIMANEHLLDGQRAGSILCMVYGKNPDKYHYLVTNGTLKIDERRQTTCYLDFKKMVTSWNALLSPWNR